MRKILVLSIALVLVASSSFAACVDSTTAGKLVFGASAAGTTLNSEGVGLSPKIVAKYCPDGAANSSVTSQWFSIATVHPGGNLAYGTAQNVNNIFHKTYTTGDTTATVLGTIPTSKASESVWGTQSWVVN